MVHSHGAGPGRHPPCVDSSPFRIGLAMRGRLGWNLNSPSGAPPSLVYTLSLLSSRGKLDLSGPHAHTVPPC